jgi:hypothetical protein
VTGRQEPALRPPPEVSTLVGFPTASPPPQVFRVSRRAHGLWWFSSRGAGRFDLAHPMGTCYLAADPLSSLLEVLAGAAETTAAFLDARQVHRLDGMHSLLADATNRAATGFGVTRELSSITPNDLPQQWAAALHEAGFDGVRYMLRFDPSPRGLAVAVFGRAGEDHLRRRGAATPVGEGLRLRLQDECGVRVIPVPSAAQLRIAAPP